MYGVSVKRLSRSYTEHATEFADVVCKALGAKDVGAKVWPLPELILQIGEEI